MRTGRISKPRAHISDAGMFMCACVASTPRYVPSIRSPKTRYVTTTVPSWPVTSHWCRSGRVGVSALARCRRGRARRTRSSRTRAAHSAPATCGSCAAAAGPPGTSRNVTSTCIQRCSGAGNDTRYSTGACAQRPPPLAAGDAQIARRPTFDIALLRTLHRTLHPCTSCTRTFFASSLVTSRTRRTPRLSPRSSGRW